MEVSLTHIILLAIFVIGVLALVLATMGARIKKRWDATSMYNVAACLVVASIISGVISFLAIWVALPNNKKVDFTHQDVVVDILGVLVTVLIGWNIFSVVDIKRKAEKIDHVTSDLDNVISGIIQLSIHSFVMRPDKEAVINSCFSSLERVLACMNDTVRDSAIKEIMKVMHQLRKTYKVGENVYIYKDQRERYKSVLWKLDDEYKDEITQMIQGAIELSTAGENIAFAGAGQADENARFSASDVDIPNNN